MKSRSEFLSPSRVERIADYQILRLLGRGGMGDVYLAWSGLRLVAIKILHAGYADDATFVAMFLAEARTAGRINHSSIAHVLDIGMDGGRLYMVMEYVAGHTLDELIRNRALDATAPVDETPSSVARRPRLRAARAEAADAEAPGPLFPLRIFASVFAHVANALAAAHRAGVAHRDVAPHNILLTDTGAVKLIDFGIARSQSSSEKTAPDVLRGRFGYMAPEYILGRQADHRVDLFALGVVMWETLARRRLYPGEAAAQIFAALDHPAPRIDEVARGIPKDIADVIDRLLERDPDRRYSSAGEVARQLEATLLLLPDGGFRDLAHWTEFHLAPQIEERILSDRSALQRILGDAPADPPLLAEEPDEPPAELSSYTASRQPALPGSTTAQAWLPARMDLGLGIAALAIILAALTLWMVVWRGGPEDGPGRRDAALPPRAEPRVEPIADADAAADADAEAAVETEAASPKHAAFDAATASPRTSATAPELPLAPPRHAAFDGDRTTPPRGERRGVAVDRERAERSKRRRDREPRQPRLPRGEAREERRDADGSSRAATTPRADTEKLAIATPPRTESAQPVAVTRPPPEEPAPPPPPARRPPPRPAATAAAAPAPVSAPRTPRVPATMAGDASRGGAVVGRCNACHAERQGKRIDARRFTSVQWERFFRSGGHDRYLPLGGRMTVGELASAMAFLSARALDTSEDQLAGVR